MAGAHHRRRKRKADEQQEASAPPAASSKVEIEYVVQAPPERVEEDEALAEAFDRLTGGGDTTGASSSSAAIDKAGLADSILQSLFSNSNVEEENENNATTTSSSTTTNSKKDLKKRTRPSVALLKQIAPRPALVEVHDVTSPDPELLVFLKSRRMAVQVPRHWSAAGKYLAGKRGSSGTQPYQLPEYIAATGIGRLREGADDAQDSVQKRQRDRARPKLGKMSVDYRVLRDAFFKYQTRPRLTKHGELYYEGKELDKADRLLRDEFVPGQLSSELKQALGMPDALSPPPWLQMMQRVGPPPSYSAGYAFPGVNAPLPPGAQYGVGGNGWGKPPVDQFGRGLFGDVMGVVSSNTGSLHSSNEPVKLWGAFVHQEEDDEEEEARVVKRRRHEEEEEEEEEKVAQPEEDKVQPIESFSFRPATAAAPAPAAALVPDQMVDLRKRPFRVLDQQQATSSGSGSVFGASHTYDVAAPAASVVVAVAPEDADDTAAIARQAAREEEDRRDGGAGGGLAPGAGLLLDSSAAAAAKKTKKPAAASKKEKFKF